MKKPEGFTLIELMIVVVIIGILSAIAIPNFVRMRENAQESKVKGTVHTVQLAAEDFSVRNFGWYSAAGADLLPLLPGAALLENAFTRKVTEPQFSAVAATEGQVGIELIQHAGEPVGYTITGFGKNNIVLSVQNGN